MSKIPSAQPLPDQSSSDVTSIPGQCSRRTILSLACLAAAAASGMPALAASLNAEVKRSLATNSGPADEDGYRTWLRYNKIDNRTALVSYRRHISSIVVAGRSETNCIVRDELAMGLSGLLGSEVPVSEQIVTASAVVVLTGQSGLLHKLVHRATLAELGQEGFLIRSTRVSGHAVTLIAANSDIGTLYGAFAFLRHLQTLAPIGKIDLVDKPKNALRILAHSDNTYAAIDRGYSGKSLWHWQDLPGKIDEIKDRLCDYARTNASVGLNGAIINKVEADPAFLDLKNLPKVDSLARVLRPYGMKVYVSANFASPMVLGGLTTADPLDPQVRQWWRDLADNIYRVIPDFGGLEVKVNSEGMTGPEDYGRTHADGANMMAEALAQHGGIVMWRAFVYDFPNKNVNEDRVKRAYLEFKPLDGEFASNVLVQAKNGPLDFQPREPFHPLFGAMPRTRMLGELQLNQEYLGQATHLVYLGTMWQEFLEADTHSVGSVADVIELGPRPGAGGFTATSNLGDDRNWTGHHFGQANWYTFGRLAWNPKLTASALALDWIKMTWSSAPVVVDCIHKMMMGSHEAYVSYTMPLGLHHLVGGDHYAPMPEGYGDPRGMFHHADLGGIGYDRTRGGSDAVDQYHPPLSDQFNGVATCPEKYLLWFHHLPWHHRMVSGRSLWQELCFKYDSGTKAAERMEEVWSALAPVIDGRRHAEVAAKLRQQAVDARHWRDHCLDYFSQFSRLPIS